MRRGTRSALPASTGDPWHYYGPTHPTTARGDSLTEVMDTDEGRHTSRQIMDTTHQLATEARGDPTTSYLEMVDPVLMFTLSDAAIADILPSPQVEETPPSGRHAMGSAGETFAPFDFEQVFLSWHGITPEEADVPASK